MRWLLSIIAVAALAGAWLSSSPLWLGVGFLVGILAALAATLAFVQARIEGTSKPESLSEPELQALKSALSAKRRNHDLNRHGTPS